jgi:NTE family protein
MASGGERRRIDLALQGGGAHGAFTWGVLDRLLEDGRVEIEGICGTSAGAMNGTVLAYGLSRGGPDEARALLRRFWEGVAHKAAFGPIRPTPLDRLLSPGNMDFSPGWLIYDTISRMVSPYVANPTNYNPLIDMLEDVVDFAWLRASCKIKLFVCATNVKNSRIKVFEAHEIDAARVMASACLPLLFQAVEIDGEAYWDGGFMGNPPLFPLIYGTETEDVLIVQINPIEIDEVPRTALEILDRVNELSFNSSLMREIRAIAFVKKLLDDNRIPHEHYKDVRLHTISAEREMGPLGYSSKLNADREFLAWLFELGRAKADVFLETGYDKLGVTSSTDIAARFL